MLERLAIRFISWNLKRKGHRNIEVVIRDDGDTLQRRNRAREESIKRTLEQIR